MRKPKILFVGGEVGRLASVRIRCRDIAQRMGCPTLYTPMTADEVPRGYDLYVCVKPSLCDAEVERLCARERVVWDYIDRVPPPAPFAAAVVSTWETARALGLTGPVFHVPHHHCNYERTAPAAGPGAVAWIGNRQWYPGPHGLDETAYFVDGYDRLDVVACFQRSGIVLNTRRQAPETGRHIAINSGIKLINAIGFGLPSVSLREPAYAEIDAGRGCTVFCEPGTVAETARALRRDPARCAELRERCRALADEYHIDRVVARYLRQIASL